MLDFSISSRLSLCCKHQKKKKAHKAPPNPARLIKTREAADFYNSIFSFQTKVSCPATVSLETGSVAKRDV